jgi:hypothetical protein
MPQHVETVDKRTTNPTRSPSTRVVCWLEEIAGTNIATTYRVRTMTPRADRSLSSRPGATGGQMLNDLRDVYSDPDTMFVVSVISEAMQRGVRHFKLDGTPLGRLNEIIDALAEDGEILMDADGSKDCPRH